MPLANALRLDDGFATVITIAGAPTVKLFEKEVTPPSFAAGGPIETTTMRNSRMRTAAPKKLLTTGQISATVAYATDSIPVLQAQIGVNQQITVTFPDGSTLAMWGWIDAFTPGNNTEGAQPTANLVVQPSNRDNAGAEQAPVYTAPVETT